MELQRIGTVEEMNEGWGGYKDIKISKEEIFLIVSLSLLEVGFLLQILDLFF